MKTWLFRIGHAPELAKHNLVAIGYNIQEYITDRNEKGIKKYFDSRADLTVKQREVISGLTNLFINKVKIGDRFITPLDKNHAIVRVSTIVSQCDTVMSFFKGKDDDYLKFFKEYANLSNPEAAIEASFIVVKPARRVKWETKEIDFADLDGKIQDALSKNQDKNQGTYNFLSTIHELHHLGNEDILPLIDPSFII